MKERKLRCFGYNCNCGHTVNVYSDAGTPPESYKCRKCGNQIIRVDQ
jgi:predicted SprT family Zn-dependent metalloprotease